jgi:hypothetical protein
MHIGGRKRRMEKNALLGVSSNIITVNRSRRVNWAGHVAHTEEMRNT